ncbi:MAG: thiosulfate oxidation carrier protein SoxY [Rhodobacteraceae bacterium]|nr:thiosulfate oxidation carrier protein SoxY [Paracoccaceae bacterium]
MELTRRDALLLGAGAVAASVLPQPLFAAEPTLDELIAAFTEGAEVKDGGVDIGAPEIAENGNTVPVDVSAEGATSILLLAGGNPSPGVATFHFGKLAVPSASTRIRLAQTQDIVAVAKLSDGSYVKASRAVKVTIGGCGG